MKRVLVIILILLMITSGCGIKEHAMFYFCQADYSYETRESFIVSEKRDIQGYSGDLPFLISLYLMGPLEKEHTRMFPEGTQLIEVNFNNTDLIIKLTDTSVLSDSRYTLACACMALTCMELCDATTITIQSAGRSITIDPNMLTLYDTEIPTQSTIGGTK